MVDRAGGESGHLPESGPAALGGSPTVKPPNAKASLQVMDGSRLDFLNPPTLVLA